MELRLLGPFEVVQSGVVVPSGGVKQQMLLAYLCLHANSHVSVSRLIDVLWGDGPPPSAKKNVQLYISRIRRLVGEGAGVQLTTAGDGYVLRIAPGQLDLDGFERLMGQGQECVRRGAAVRAGELFHDARRLWRGEALCGLTATDAMQAESVRLEHLRILMLSQYFGTQLELGRHFGLIPDLVRCVTSHPHQERLRGYLMTALWRSGQRDEAVATYLDAHRLMVEDLGIRPGKQLQLLYQAILADEPEAASRITPELDPVAPG